MKYKTKIYFAFLFIILIAFSLISASKIDYNSVNGALRDSAVENDLGGKTYTASEDFSIGGDNFEKGAKFVFDDRGNLQYAKFTPKTENNNLVNYDFLNQQFSFPGWTVVEYKAKGYDGSKYDTLNLTGAKDDYFSFREVGSTAPFNELRLLESGSISFVRDQDSIKDFFNEASVYSSRTAKALKGTTIQGNDFRVKYEGINVPILIREADENFKLVMADEESTGFFLKGNFKADFDFLLGERIKHSGGYKIRGDFLTTPLQITKAVEETKKISTNFFAEDDTNGNVFIDSKDFISVEFGDVMGTRVAVPVARKKNVTITPGSNVEIINGDGSVSFKPATSDSVCSIYHSRLSNEGRPERDMIAEYCGFTFTIEKKQLDLALVGESLTPKRVWKRIIDPKGEKLHFARNAMYSIKEGTNNVDLKIQKSFFLIKKKDGQIVHIGDSDEETDIGIINPFELYQSALNGDTTSLDLLNRVAYGEEGDSAPKALKISAMMYIVNLKKLRKADFEEYFRQKIGSNGVKLDSAIELHNSKSYAQASSLLNQVVASQDFQRLDLAQRERVCAILGNSLYREAIELSSHDGFNKEAVIQKLNSAIEMYNRASSFSSSVPGKFNSAISVIEEKLTELEE